VADLPPNVREFNTLAGLILAKLYLCLPGFAALQMVEFAQAMNIPESEIDSRKLASGVSFHALWNDTLVWLSAEGFTRPTNMARPEILTLTMKGLGVLNAVPPDLKQTLGTAMVNRAPPATCRGSAICSAA
jgi:hypothetical protein